MPKSKKGHQGFEKEHHYDEKTAEWVRESTRNGLKVNLMANSLGMSVNTLYRLYGQDVAVAKAEAANTVGKRVYVEAMDPDGDPKLAIHYTKTQLEWVEKDIHSIKLDEEEDKDINNSAIESLVSIIEAKKRKDKKDETDDS